MLMQYMRSGLIAAVGVAVSLVMSAQEAVAQGLTLRVAPEVSSYRWSGPVGLQSSELFGAAASLGFGRYVSLRTSYKLASGVSTALAGSGYGAGGVNENDVRVSLLATDVQLRLGSGRIAPVLTGGGGVLGLNPDGRSRTRQVVASYGGGIDARVFPWLDGQLLLQDSRFRLDRSTLASDAAPPADPESGELRSALVLTASLGARLGGGRASQTADRLDRDLGESFSGGDGLGIPVALTTEVMRFSDKLAIGQQTLGGVRAGFDFGPYFGLRGSYARGFSGGSLIGMSSWSGEAQFNVGRVTGVAPHLLLGYGRLSFWGDFLDENGARPADQDALILGAGLGIPITGRTRLVVSARDYVTSAGSVSGVSQTADLRHSLGLSAGLSFALRGVRRGPPTGAPPLLVESPGVEPEPAEEAAPAPLVAPQAVAAADSPPEAVEVPTAPEAQPAVLGTSSAPSAADATSGFQSDRTVLLPIPTQGELHVRYGPPTTVAPAASPSPQIVLLPQGVALTAPRSPSDSTVASQLVGSEIGGPQAGVVTRDDLRQMEDRLSELLASVVVGVTPAVEDDSLSGSDTTLAVSAEDLAALEERLTTLLTESMQAAASAAQPDSASIASLVRDEMASDTSRMVSPEDLAALEERLTTLLTESMQAAASTAQPDSASITSLVRDEMARASAGQAGGAEVDSLAAEELVARIDERIREREAERDETGAVTDPRIEDLSARVDLLTEMLARGQEAGALTSPEAPTVVPIVTNVESGQSRGPLVRAVELVGGTTSVRHGTGVGARLDVFVSELMGGRLHPYAGVQAARTGVSGSVAGTGFSGNVTTLGTSLGVTAGLPSVRSVSPSLNASLVALGGGRSGDSPADAALVRDTYDGFVMGPRLALDAKWRRDPSSRWMVTGSVGRTWASARGGWSFQIGLRWERPSAPSGVLFSSTAPPAGIQVVSERPVSGGQADRQPAQTAPAAAGPAAAPAADPAAGPAVDIVTLSRIEELQRALDMEREARLRSEAAADSLARRAELVEARVDSLAARDEATTGAESRESALRSELQSLLGVLDVVQDVGQTARGIEVRIGGAFPSGGMVLEGAARGQVQRVARVLVGAEAQAFLVEGHTDSSGPEEVNLRLSRSRAEAVRDVLVGAGIPSSAISVLASGETSPIAGNDTPEGRARNRRVEIVVTRP